MLLAVIDLLFGTILIMLALATLRQWQALNLALRAITVTWSIAGPVLLASGIAALVSLGRLRPPLWIGGTALIAAGSAYVLGIVTHVIPCAGPT